MVVIGDQNKETVTRVVDLLKEYEDLFPQKFSKMKGTAVSLGEMNIPLKPYAKPKEKTLSIESNI